MHFRGKRPAPGKMDPGAGKSGPRRRETSTPAPGTIFPGGGVDFSRRRGPFFPALGDFPSKRHELDIPREQATKV